VEGEGIFVGDVDNFDDAMFEGGGFRRFQSILLGAAILPGGIRTAGNTTFEIWAKTPKSEALPLNFRVRWWAYKAGSDLGTIFYTPKDIPV
jgi:hypothetical protein